MSEFLSAAAERLGAPEDIVLRSAQARASADGLDIDEVLQAWSGGAAVATAVAQAPPVEAPSVEAPPVVAAEEEAPVPEPVAPVAVAAPPAPVVLPAEPEPEEPIEVPSLSRRVKPPAALGAAAGLVLALVGLLLAAPWLIGAVAATPGDLPQPAFLVSAPAALAAVALMSLVFGGLTAVLGRGLPTYAHPGAQLAMGAGAAFVIGAAAGVVLGGAAAGLLLGVFGETIEVASVEASQIRTLLPLLPTLWLALLGGTLLGASSAALPHVIGIPAALRGEEAEEPAVIRRRLSIAYGAPLLILPVTLVLVYSLSRVLLTWPQYAPAAATLIALAVLGFAALMRIRPGTRLRRGDVYAALSGLAVIVIVILAILTTFGGEDEHSPEEPAESHAIVRLT